ncbi:TPA: hypothetical protein ACW7Y1_000328 [Enterobacter hormaechei subsp. steigerwaltii]|uniref:hypothetical protein n=1 Tax=Enterobacter cloacae complex sp. P45RS TaxID=2779542 RepID=UPI00187246AF|nr:hypothetical protein [Enterobacter cloacae complex sp. P45RS]MBE4889594.1 hypothetical protein [Enterobacter cloacae complex sp. P45RS]
MSTITKERLQRLIRAIDSGSYDEEEIVGWVNSDEIMELARIALASLEADGDSEPVAFINGAWTLVYYRPPKELGLKVGDKLYAAPPAPVSVPDFGALTKCIVQRLVDYGTADDDAIASAEEFVYNACRAAMLQSFGNSEQLELVTTTYNLRDAVEAIRNAGIAIGAKKIQEARDALNSPVIPDGWVMVPEEPTHEMLEAGDEQFGTYDVYRRMIAASPQQK